MEKESREDKRRQSAFNQAIGRRESENMTVGRPPCLQGVHISEGMIQLLADSLEFQLLSVQFVCRSKGGQQRESRIRGECRGVEGNHEEKERNQRGQIGKKRFESVS